MERFKADLPSSGLGNGTVGKVGSGSVNESIGKGQRSVLRILTGFLFGSFCKPCISLQIAANLVILIENAKFNRQHTNGLSNQSMLRYVRMNGDKVHSTLALMHLKPFLKAQYDCADVYNRNIYFQSILTSQKLVRKYTRMYCNR